MPEKKEYFKPVILEGEETSYEVSNLGRVYNKKTKKFLKGTFARNEYHTVQLTLANKTLKSVMTHRLVAGAFCIREEGQDFVDHINGNKHDNRAENLRWVSPSENAKNQRRAGKRTAEKLEIELDELRSAWIDLFGIIKENELLQKETYYINQKGVVYNALKRERVLEQDRSGYKRVRVAGVLYSLHRLVWQAFKGDIPNGLFIDHIDRDRSNNRLANLRLVSHSENCLNKSPKNLISIKGVSKEDSSKIVFFSSIAEAARFFKISHAAISSAVRRQGASCGYYWFKSE